MPAVVPAIKEQNGHKNVSKKVEDEVMNISAAVAKKKKRKHKPTKNNNHPDQKLQGDKKRVKFDLSQS